MARRFGKFNPRQPRDRNGRWTKGGSGGSARKSSSKPAGKSRIKTLAAKAQAKKKNPGSVEYGLRAYGNIAGAAFAASTGSNIVAGAHLAALGTNVYRIGSKAAANQVAKSKRLSASQKRNFTVRKNNVDRIVSKVEKGTDIIIAGAWLGNVAKTGAAYWIAGNQGAAARSAGGKVLGAIGSGGAGLKFKKPRRGVYNITTL